MFLEGDSTITPRLIIERGYRCAIRCDRCRYSIEPLWGRPPWSHPKIADTHLFKLMPKMKCSRIVDGRECGGPAVEVHVWRMTGRGSQTEDVLRLMERLE